MIDPIERSFECFDVRQAGSLGALDHDHLDAELPRRLNLRIGRRAATVLGDDHLDAMPAQHLQLALQAKRPPAMDVADIGRRQRRLDGIDATDPIVVLRSSIGIVSLLPSGRQEHPQRGRAKCRDGLRDTLHGNPVISFDRRPCRPAQGKGWNTALSRRLCGIGGDACRERMSRVDHQIDGFVTQIAGKTLCAAEAAAAHWNRLWSRIGGSACERQDNIKIGAGGECHRERAGLGRAAQDQYAGLAHG